MGRKRGSRSGLERERARRRLLAERCRGVERSQGTAGVDANVPSGSSDGGRAVEALPAGPSASRARRASLTLVCEWCGADISAKSRGPLPRWCSPSCRHRAWERTRALQSLGDGHPQPDHPFLAVPIDTVGWLGLLRALSVELARAQLDPTAVARALEEMRVEFVERRTDRLGDAWGTSG